jgi:GxxExxY protein
LKNIQELKYADITEKIICIALKVHTYFGAGFSEIVYHRAMLIELEKIGFSVESEKEQPIFYEQKLIAKRRLDLLIEKKVLIELKAVVEIHPDCMNQVLNYLKVFNIEVGLLLNFGAKSLQIRRFVWNKSVLASL